MYSLGVNRLGVTNTNSNNSVKSLFTAGEKGAWYDPSDLSSMFQNADKTVAAVIGQPVGYITDKSGNVNHAVQSDVNKKPILREDAVGSLYLEFDGSNDCLKVAGFDMTGTDEVTHFTGHKKVGTSNSILLETSSDSSTLNGTFKINAPPTNTAQGYVFSARGTSYKELQVVGYDEPLTAITTYQCKISTPEQSVTINRNTAIENTGTMGTGDFDVKILNIGSRNNGTSLPFEGRIYSIIIRGKLTTDAHVSNIESYVAQKTGIATQIDNIATLNLNFENDNYQAYDRNGGVV
tara:strand:- start:615 stop:1493 length:879 start_codon:yes stop_codon:yes gene_type:complete